MKSARRWQVGSLTYGRYALAALFFWLLCGDFGFWLKELAVPPTLQLLLHRYGASDLFVGILWADLPQLLIVLVVPIVAYHSDRHRGRWGRRIPFLVVCVPLLFVSMVGLAFSPRLGVGLHSALDWAPGSNRGILVSFTVSWSLFELGAVVSNSMFRALIADVVPRELLGRFFGLFRTVWLSAGILFNYYILGIAESQSTWVFLGVGGIYCFTFGAMCLKVKEGRYPAVEMPSAEIDQPKKPVGTRLATGVKRYLRECFSLPYYRWVLFAFALGTVTMLPVTLFGMFYAKSLKMEMGVLGKYIAVMLSISLVQAYPVGWLADRFHPLRVAVVAQVFITICMFSAFFLVHDERTLGIAWVVCGVASGVYGTIVVSLPAVLFPRAQFAVFDSAKAMCIAITQMVVGPACGYLLGLLHQDYHYIYLMSATAASAALVAHLIVYRKINKYGGLKAYVAPVALDDAVEPVR